jgi:hypothetical protein
MAQGLLADLTKRMGQDAHMDMVQEHLINIDTHT